MKEPKFCKDCIRAKYQNNMSRMMYCGKHRQYITEFTMTCFGNKDMQDCKDYERRKTK